MARRPSSWRAGGRGGAHLAWCCCVAAALSGCDEDADAVTSTTNGDPSSSAGTESEATNSTELDATDDERTESEVEAPSPGSSDPETSDPESSGIEDEASSTSDDSSPARPNPDVQFDSGPEPVQPTASSMPDVTEVDSDVGMPSPPEPTATDEESSMTPPSGSDAGVGEPNVPSVDILPVQCVDTTADMSAGRCSLQRSCDGDQQIIIACDTTVEDWSCDCLFGVYPKELKFGDVELQDACEASLTFCDPARGPALASLSCEVASAGALETSCWHERECVHQWSTNGVTASSLPYSTRAGCTLDADMQRWDCDCRLDGEIVASYTFSPGVPHEATCTSAGEVCDNLDALVPEFGAECTLLDEADSGEVCVSEYACAFDASVAGQRLHVSADIHVRCEPELGALACYLGTRQARTKLARPAQTGACAAFTADELVGLASLPTSPIAR